MTNTTEQAIKRTEFKLINIITKTVKKKKTWIGLYLNSDNKELYKKGSSFNDLASFIQTDFQEDGVYVLSGLSKVIEEVAQ
jgi:hypothetical protein